jgi:hypothetical protein
MDSHKTRDWDKAVEELVRIGKPAVDPLIAFIFGLRSLEEIVSAFPEGLDTVLFASFARDRS